MEEVEKGNRDIYVRIPSVMEIRLFVIIHDLGRLPQIKEQIIEMSLNGSGIRDIARVLKISPTTVIEEIKKRNQAERYKYRFAAPA